jgi:hypothetical protein
MSPFTGFLNVESHFCGGNFSDAKMYTKQIKRGRVSRAWRACVLMFLALSVHAELLAAAVDTAQDAAALQEQLRQQQRDEALRKQQQA